MKAETQIGGAVRRKSTIVSAIDAAEHLGLDVTVKCGCDSVRALVLRKPPRVREDDDPARDREEARY